MNNQKTIKTWSTPVTTETCQLIPCALCGGSRFKKSIACEGFCYSKCAACGLVQISPQPLRTEVLRRYAENFGNKYLEYELSNEANFLHLQKLALEDAGFDEIERELFQRKERKPRVLDVGCATGALLDFLRNRGWQTTGLEISPSAEYARVERGLDVRRSSLEDAGFPPDSFDLALASHVIEHLNNPVEFIGELWRALRPGSYLLLTTPNISGFQARLFGGRWRSAIFDHLYLFSVRTLRAMLKKKGFIIEGIYTWGGLAAGTAPRLLKRFADYTAKALGLGDVMLVKARKPNVN
jgi:SAM-dependent methyltransferase